MVFKLIGTIIISFLIVGGAIYYYYPEQFNVIKDDLSDQLVEQIIAAKLDQLVSKQNLTIEPETLATCKGLISNITLEELEG